MKLNWMTIVAAVVGAVISAATVVFAAGFSQGTREARLDAVEVHVENPAVHMTPELHQRIGRIEGYLKGLTDHFGIKKQ